MTFATFDSSPFDAADKARALAAQMAPLFNRGVLVRNLRNNAATEDEYDRLDDKFQHIYSVLSGLRPRFEALCNHAGLSPKRLIQEARAAA